MHVLTDLGYLLEDEVGQVVKKGEISPTELDNVYKAVKTLNYIETIRAMKGYNEDGDYSRGRMMNTGRDYAYGEMRDYGRYARHSKEDKIAQLEHMMENASSEVERRAFMDAIRSIEKQ